MRTHNIQEIDLPHIAVIDSRTGAKIVTMKGESFINNHNTDKRNNNSVNSNDNNYNYNNTNTNNNEDNNDNNNGTFQVS